MNRTSEFLDNTSGLQRTKFKTLSRISCSNQCMMKNKRGLEKKSVRRQQLVALSWILMWIGAIEMIASFLASFWFQMELQYTSVFFLLLLIGLTLFLITRII
ncbi:hypothetical protein D2Q93_03140 [Alicyclobacillaceae bacterium I2511]|nr:hypothetical protein D2Q93_03140 [Alicyclobacillaceae bacterium I2511]